MTSAWPSASSAGPWETLGRIRSRLKPRMGRESGNTSWRLPWGLFRRTNAKFTETGTVGNIGRNGSVLEIIAIDAAGLTLKNNAGREGAVAWETLRDEASGRVHLAYGDALTTNTAQGITG